MSTPLGQITGELRDVREWTGQIGTATPAISSTKAMTGAYSVAFNLTSQTALIGHAFPAQTGLRCGAWLNHNGRSTSSTGTPSTFFRLRNSSTVVAEIRWNYSTADVEMWINGTKVTQASAVACGVSSTNMWMHIGLVYIQNGSCTFYVDGLPRLTWAQDLTSPVNEAYFGGQWAVTAYLDDFYIDGGITVDVPPPTDRFLFSAVNGAGSSSNWTPVGAANNYDCVDDGVPDDDVTYVLSNAADQLDLYATSDITVPTGYSIRAAIPIVLTKVTASGPQIKLVASDGSNVVESAAKTPGASYIYIWESMNQTPSAQPWTQALFNDATFGIKSAGSFS